jgi:hypothetical protein
VIDVAAVGHVAEAVRYAELGVERKKQREPRRPARIDGLVAAGPGPGTAQAVVAGGFRAERLGRCVMQEATQRQVAPVLIRPRVQDEFMPHHIDCPRRHRDEPTVAALAGQEELAQSAFDQVAVLAGQLRVGLAQLALEELRQRRLANGEITLPVRPERRRDDHCDQQGEQHQPQRSSGQPARNSNREGHDRERGEAGNQTPRMQQQASLHGEGSQTTTGFGLEADAEASVDTFLDRLGQRHHLGADGIRRG